VHFWGYASSVVKIFRASSYGVYLPTSLGLKKIYTKNDSEAMKTQDQIMKPSWAVDRYIECGVVCNVPHAM
jgi:hypothetical protein